MDQIPPLVKPEYHPSMSSREVLETAVQEREWALKRVSDLAQEQIGEYAEDILAQILSIQGQGNKGKRD